MINPEASKSGVPMRAAYAFFFLTYAITWICTAAGLGGIASSGLWFSASRTLLLVVGSLAPSIVALGLTGLESGWNGPAVLLHQLFDRRVGLRWYLFAVSYPLLILLAVEATSHVVTGGWMLLRVPSALAVAVSTVLSAPVRASEEIGWRGYALPRLAQALGLKKASLVLGPVWACSHLPLFLIPGLSNYGRSVPMYILEVTASSVAFAWVYGDTRGSLLPVILMHSAINEMISVLPSPRAAASLLAFNTELTPWLVVAFEWIIATYLLGRFRWTVTDQERAQFTAVNQQEL